MNQPGRKYSNGSGYRYGFNRQEKDRELNENINTAMYWEYDSRIGRRWNIDPVLKAGGSSYMTFACNPIWIKDHLGNDTTKYYDNKNNLLLTVGNGKPGYNRVMIVKDDKVKAIQKYASENLEFIKSGKPVRNNVEIDNSFMKNGFGVVYDMNAIKKFLQDNKNRKALFLNSADKYNGRQLSSYGKLSIDGKTLKWIRSETTGGLVLNNNIVTVGNVRYFINEAMVKSSGYSNSSEQDWVAGIHDHPFGDKPATEVHWYTGMDGSSWNFIAGPSPEINGSGDKSAGNASKAGYRNVVIDDVYIYLYNNSDPDIKIKYR